MILIYTLLLSATLYHLGSRATITRWLWSRYPRWFDRFMDCAACSGTWYGAGLSVVFHTWRGYDYPSLDEWWTPIVIGFVSTVTTPMIAALQQMGLDRLGSATEPEEEQA